MQGPIDHPSAVYAASAGPDVHAALLRAREESGGACELPSPELLAALLETAFFATLTDDEGRPTVFKLAFAARGRAGPGWTCVGIVPRRLDVEALRRLAPATADAHAAIAVGADGLGMVADGFLVSVSADPDGLPWQGLMLVGRGRGVVDVNLAGRRIASLVRGSLRRYEAHLHERDLLEVIADAAPAVAGEPPHAELLAALRVADAMAGLDHGGTLLVVPEGPYDAIPGLRPHPRFPIAEGAQRFLARAVDEYRARNGIAAREQRRAAFAEAGFDEWVEERLRDRDARRALEQAARLVAGLTAVDGAVVMTASLEVLAFGAMIDVVPDPELTDVAMVDPLAPGVTLRRPPQALGGARHQSAIAFCRQQPRGALAFASSQDGTLTLFLRSPTDVVALRPLDLTAARS